MYFLLIKLIAEVFGNYFKLNLKYLILLLEFLIIILYFFFLLKIGIDFNFFLFLWCLVWFIIVGIYKLLYYVNMKFEEILLWVEKKEKIKKILLKPIINKTIYYLTWMLPWNINYWIYFWIMENSWYLRVWINSNRDIFFWKHFRWDSRDFFFKWNEKLKIISFSNEFLKNFLRLIFIFSKIRKNILKYNIFEYMLSRIMIFSYLSIFYLFFFEEVILFNKYILYLLLFLEFLFIIFSGYILKKLFSNYEKIKNNFFIKNFILIIGIENIKIFIDPVNEGTEKLLVFEYNNTVWNIILGESISLNFLHKYMIWVNKNTKGYYYKQMNILPRLKYIKLLNRANIPWDILPNTRYVLYQLRHVQYNSKSSFMYKVDKKTQKFYDNLLFGKDLTIPKEFSGSVFVETIPDYKLADLKNLYLSYFEKTYSDVSILCIQYLLRVNYDYFLEYKNLFFFDEEFRQKLDKLDSFKKNKYETYCYNNLYANLTGISNIWYFYLLFFNRKNKAIFSIEYFVTLFSRYRFVDIEGNFMIYFIQESSDYKKLTEIPLYYQSISSYKKKFLISSKFMWYEEEGIVWNEDLQSCLSFYYNNMSLRNSNLYLNSKMEDKLSLLSKYGNAVNTNCSMKENIEEYIENFGLKFNKDIFSYEDFDFIDLHFFDNLELIDWNFDELDLDILLEECEKRFDIYEKLKFSEE